MNGDMESEVQDDATVEDAEASNQVRYEITSYGADYLVDGLVKRLRNEDIYLPDFQRGYVWPLPQASRFIESLLLGLPAPSIFLSKDADTRKLLVIDGQQRLLTLQRFYDGTFGQQPFRLRGVAEEFEGKTYAELGDEDRRRLDDAILHAIVIRQDGPSGDNSSVYMVFERLNTTSMALSPQEIRACVYHGPFNDYLAEANKNADWRAIFGRENPRQKDRELLLRFFALFYDRGSYRRPMKLFLSSFMDSNRHLERYDESALDAVLKPTVALANETLTPSAFRPERALNTSVTDAILVGVATRLEHGPVTDECAFQAAMRDVLDDELVRSTNLGGTTNADNIHARIDRVSEALQSVT